MHRVHAGYTVIARITPGKVEEANAECERLERDHSLIPFDRVLTTHFATITVIPAHHWEGEDLPASLLFATSFWGPANDHVDELVQHLHPALCRLFRLCEGFPANGGKEDLYPFLRAHRHPDAFYSGMQGLTRAEVVSQHALREEIGRFLDDLPAGDRKPEEVRAAIQEHIRTHPQFSWAMQPVTTPPGTWLALHAQLAFAIAIAAPFLLALVLGTIGLVRGAGWLLVPVALGWTLVVAGVGFLIALLLTVRVAESQQRFVCGRPPDELAWDLARTQLRPVINEVTIAGPIKEGFTRPLFLRLALWLVARLAEGIPHVRDPLVIPTVATARWIAADGGRRLIFISNYTNSAEGYVRDFIDTPAGAENINISFGFGRGYPKTRWIALDGAVTDPNAFMHVVTTNQHKTAFWYGPYKNLSIDNIKINRMVREDLPGTLSGDKLQNWLHLL